jgi:hypothetical protein
MSDRQRSCHPPPHQQHVRQAFEDKCRALEDEIRKKNEAIDALKYATKMNSNLIRIEIL